MIGVAVLTLACGGAMAQSHIEGRVVAVADGDTLTLLDGGQTQHKIRLAEIDAPEKGQPFGNRARQTLAELCAGAWARAAVQTVDRYGRAVARVWCNDVDANSEQLKLGMAWVYDRYVVDRTLYVVQADAKQAGRGLWVDRNAEPPWDFRRRSRAK